MLAPVGSVADTTFTAATLIALVTLRCVSHLCAAAPFALVLYPPVACAIIHFFRFDDSRVRALSNLPRHVRVVALALEPLMLGVDNVEERENGRYTIDW
eukprot:CAMPEP_0119300350 /NCGR_PEP_ID=MMETSP1333-20130426/2298_1 /TAXON_ID=418940 /ORGANISM="Scyphosphaera apsteinii, Strain RCC1455" /LENGTH=98 /DNA_ID=CAMNT_0007302083 /DNA_START=909 /DNA_END=1205 /DNA_ORIENTATION=-